MSHTSQSARGSIIHSHSSFQQPGSQGPITAPMPGGGGGVGEGGIDNMILTNLDNMYQQEAKDFM